MHASIATFRTAGFALAFALAALCGTPCLAETQDFSRVQSLLKQQNFDEAEKQVDAVLKAEPDNVNALMYKGNIVFYRNSNVTGMQVYGNDDESIYDSDIGALGAGSSLISRETAQNVAAYFKRALARAPQRMDIQLGLCWMYANAGMKDELIARFPELQKYGAQHNGLQYNMGDYARVIIDNYSFDDGIAVYREISRLYPDDGNISNDIAAMYLKHHDLDTAMKYFAEAAGRKMHDDDTWQNLALLYAITGDRAKSLEAQKTVSQLHKDDAWVLYDALCKRLQNDAGWQGQVQAFIRKHKGGKRDQGYVAFAQAVLPVDGKYSEANFAAARQAKVPTQFLLLHDEWLARSFPDRFDAAFDFGDMLVYYSNYRRALQQFDAMEQRKPPFTADQMEQVHFHQAWALHASGQEEAATAKWKPLLASRDFYRKSAAAYFLASYAEKRKRYKEAADYCGQVKEDASHSKYATYCANLYDSAVKQK